MKKRLTTLVCAFVLALTPMAVMAMEEPPSSNHEELLLDGETTPEKKMVSYAGTNLVMGPVWYITANNVCLRCYPSGTKLDNNIIGYVQYNNKFLPGYKDGVWQYAYMISGDWQDKGGYVHQNYCAPTNYGYMSIGKDTQ